MSPHLRCPIQLLRRRMPNCLFGIEKLLEILYFLFHYLNWMTGKTFLVSFNVNKRLIDHS